MLKVVSENLELRGVASNTTKNGKTYYMVNAETHDGTAYQFYCPTYEALPQGMKKGDMVKLHFVVKYFNRNERLEVVQVEKVV